ncbi:3-ketoacyl-ACP reductase [Rhizobium sp. P32RR-XVIII]|uniref:3-ketoacyl-ACP reductase n=1 Tax=Rhizobium sp. P32RR-XVIII TaxID=2726738 RepID=UPI0014569BF5|nr:3-ketoacyl-ACP reductase [Rhizobium sp. P32RR-XVIII]NLS08068.1 3-ketoacyl-ACP reductase [Rhizobium sp. P32RR-XVIII]
MSSGYRFTSAKARGGALVTGGGSGIGYATAIALAERGFEVTVASVEDSAFLPEHISYVRADITDISEHEALVRRVRNPVCLVNCAGVTSLVRGDLMELTPLSFDRVMGVNVRATFFLTQTFARHMLQADATENYRSIIFVGSINSHVVGETRADYCMSKSAVAMMSKLFAARLAGDGIMTHEVRPGVIRTPMTAAASERYDRLIVEGGIPAGRWGEVDDVAGAITALALGSFPYATGTAVDIAGGLQIHRV